MTLRGFSLSLFNRLRAFRRTVSQGCGFCLWGLFGYLGVVLGRFLVLLGVRVSKVLLDGVWGLVLVWANGFSMAPGRPPDGFWAFF